MTSDPRWTRGRFACHLEPSVGECPHRWLLLTTILRLLYRPAGKK